ncbi:MAG: 30S ribosomal protein S20, partial [Pseudomonadota bacterium]
MAHHKSAEKRIRQTEYRTGVNRMRVSEIRSAIKAVETAIEAGNKQTAQDQLRNAQPIIMSG